MDEPDDESKDKVNNVMSKCVKAHMKKGMSQADAEKACEAKLSKSNYDVETLEFILDRTLLERK
jgi:hypothetical protein